MKTQEAAKLLNFIASVIRSSPFETIEEMSERRPHRVDAQSVDVPRALSMLVALSSFDKAQWQQIIKDYNFPIEVRPRDASRDVLGKILNHLEASPEARTSLATSSTRLRPGTSPELAQALEFLLKS